MYIMPIFYTLHTLVYKYHDLIPLPEGLEDRHCLMILGGTVAWTVIWIALNSIQRHPLWNSLRSSFIAILAADLIVMLYIWNRSIAGKTTQKPVKRIIPIEHTTNALNDYYNSIPAELVSSEKPDIIKAKMEQEAILKRGGAIVQIQKWWRERKLKRENNTEEFHSIISSNA